MHLSEAVALSPGCSFLSCALTLNSLPMHTCLPRYTPKSRLFGGGMQVSVIHTQIRLVVVLTFSGDNAFGNFALSTLLVMRPLHLTLIYSHNPICLLHHPD